MFDKIPYLRSLRRETRILIGVLVVVFFTGLRLWGGF